MSTNTLSFDGVEICNIRMVDDVLIITNLQKRMIFTIHLYIGYTLRRNDFLKKHKKVGNELRYQLRNSDILILLSKGFVLNGS